MVEEGIEIGKKMMAEMIATYSAPASPKGSDYLNEVRSQPGADVSH
jgi:hypothetical protein